MRIFLMQHAKAKSKEIDPERGLSNEGINNILKISNHLAKISTIKFSGIIHSGKKRARQTAEILAEHLNYSVEVKESSGLSPNDRVEDFEARLEEINDSLIVGHLPYLDKLTSFLVTGNQDKSILKFQNAGLLCLECIEDKWVISWYLTPQVLE